MANKGAPAAVVPAGMIAVAGYLGALPDDLVPRLGPPRFATYGGDSGTMGTLVHPAQAHALPTDHVGSASTSLLALTVRIRRI